MFKYKCIIKIHPDESVGYVESFYYDRDGIALTQDSTLYETVARDDSENEEDDE